MPVRRPDEAQFSNDGAAARAAAVALLARRDLPTGELQARLRGQGFDAETAAAVSAALSREGVLNDERFAQNYVVYRAGRGRGPLRIIVELRRHGLADELIETALAAGPDWVALAHQVRRARFGAQPPASWPQRARQSRFLQYRGFSADHIRLATGVAPDLD
jgi:regulatory protein